MDKKGYEKKGKGLHDAFVKQTLGRIDLAQNFLQTYLPEEIRAEMDLSTLKACKGEYVDPKLRKHFFDLLFEVQRQGEPSFVYILVEHKSYPDKKVAFQLLGYMAKIWQQSMQQGEDKAPLILPILIYNGYQPWEVEPRLQSFLQGGEKLSEAFRRYVPNFAFLTYDYSPGNSTPIQGSPFLKTILTALRAAREKDREEFLKSVTEISIIFQESKGDKSEEKEIFTVVFYYLMHAQQEVTVEEIMEAAGERGEDVKSLADRLYEEGLEEGIEEGIEEGKMQSALRFIARGMPMEEVSQVLGIPEEKILEFQRKTREQR